MIVFFNYGLQLTGLSSKLGVISDLLEEHLWLTVAHISPDKLPKVEVRKVSTDKGENLSRSLKGSGELPLNHSGWRVLKQRQHTIEVSRERRVLEPEDPSRGAKSDTQPLRQRCDLAEPLLGIFNMNLGKRNCEGKEHIRSRMTYKFHAQVQGHQILTLRSGLQMLAVFLHLAELGGHVRDGFSEL